MQTLRNRLDFFVKHGLLLAAAAGLVLTSAYRQEVPLPSSAELDVLFLLFAFFISVKGLERTGLMRRLTAGLEKGKYLSLKLVALTFTLSMFVTNDVALLVLVPMTCTLKVDRRGWLVILEALAANAGSALTPFGNPQNLFIYWFYDLQPVQFFSAIAPFSFFFLVLLVAISLLVRIKPLPQSDDKPVLQSRFGVVYAGFLLLLIAVVLRVLPLWIAGTVILFALVFDRKSLSVDYSLLMTFLLFFMFTENLKFFLAKELEHRRHIFLLSAMASQFISNVPAALLIAKFTSQWKALLWGTNVGGFGSPVGSLANLIAYRIFVAHPNGKPRTRFTIQFVSAEVAALLLGMILFFLVGLRL